MAETVGELTFLLPTALAFIVFIANQLDKRDEKGSDALTRERDMWRAESAIKDGVILRQMERIAELERSRTAAMRVDIQEARDA